MNYYEHHLGDYLRDTAHLSMLEDGAYRRLMDAYYIREAPLPTETREVFRLVRAQSKQDREAVETVLREFFKQTPAGWVHGRCEKEISRFQDKQRKARASAEARWSQRQPQSEGNANASPDAMRTHSEGNAPRARPQTPDTRHQSNTQPLPFPEVREALKTFAANAPKEDAKAFHAAIVQAMRDAGWDVETEVHVEDRGDGRGGRVDIVVSKPCAIGIELDRLSPRLKSIDKLQQIDGYRVVMLREAGEDSVAHGLDAVIGCATADEFGGVPIVPCPYSEIVRAYHETLPSLPRVLVMPTARQRAMRKLWGWVLSSTKADGTPRARDAAEALGWFRAYFARAAENDFLMGRTPRSAEHAGWQCDLDFLLTDRGLKQVIERTRDAA